jgi:hypothetical protein
VGVDVRLITIMKPRFQLSQIPEIAARYAYPRERSVEVLVPVVRRQGYMTRHELTTLCHWKSPRSAGHVSKNSRRFVEEITRFALLTTDERARIESLTLLDAVDYPTASTILHWFHRDPYPIVDFRALWSLRLSERPPYSFPFWQSYVLRWRSILRQAQRRCAPVVVTPRLLDKALWSYSDEHQAQNAA